MNLRVQVGNFFFLLGLAAVCGDCGLLPKLKSLLCSTSAEMDGTLCVTTDVPGWIDALGERYDD